MLCHGCEVIYVICELVHVYVSCCLEFVPVKEEVHPCLDLICLTVSTQSFLSGKQCLPVSASLNGKTVHTEPVFNRFASLTVSRYPSNSQLGSMVELSVCLSIFLSSCSFLILLPYLLKLHPIFYINSNSVS